MLLMYGHVVSKHTKWKTFKLQLLMGRSESDSSKLWLPWNFLECRWYRDQTSWAHKISVGPSRLVPLPSMFQRNAFSPVTHLGFGLFRVDLNHCSAFRITVWPRLRGCRAWWICVSCTSATTASKSSRDWRTMWAGSCWLCDGVVALSCSR